MKKLCVLVCVIASYCGVYASQSDLQSVVWLPSGGEYYINTVEDAVMYRVDRELVEERSSLEVVRSVIDVEEYKKKRFSKSIYAQVVGYHNREIGLYYDTYVVDYEGGIYLLPKEFADANVELDAANNRLENERIGYHQSIDLLETSIDSKQLEIELFRRSCVEKLGYYNAICDSLPMVINDVEERAATDYVDKINADFDRKYALWYNSLPSSTLKALKTIKIDNEYLESPNSAGGCDYHFMYTNKSDKVIKYLNWYGYVYNAVDDMVSCDITGSSHVSGRDTGPVEVNNKYSAGGTWGTVIYNYSADRVELHSIDIQYMDNSRTSIAEADIKRMLAEPERVPIYTSDINDVKEKASEGCRDELTRCEGEASYWKRRVSVLDETDNLTNVRFHESDIAAASECQDLYFDLLLLKQDRDAIIVKQDNFERKNFLDEKANVDMAVEIAEQRAQNEYDSKLIKRVYVGAGYDLLLSSNFIGSSFPVELLLGDIDQRLNVSVSGAYTILGSSSDIKIKQFSPFVTLYYNMGKSDWLCFPISFGVGYNFNLGSSRYNVTGNYWDEDYHTTDFSFPIDINKNNLTSIASIGIRGRHFLFSMYGRFDLTSLIDNSFGIGKGVIPESSSMVFYDDIFIDDVVDAMDGMSLFGMAVRVYF